MNAERTRLRLALRAARFPSAARRHACAQIEDALMLYREPMTKPSKAAQEFRELYERLGFQWEARGKGRPRDTRLESLLIAVAVQFHAALPDVPGVTKRGTRYSGALVDFTRRVFDAAGIDPSTRDLGRLIYSVVRKGAQIHGDLDHYPPMSKLSRKSWSLPSDVTVPDDPQELAQLYASRRRRGT